MSINLRSSRENNKIPSGRKIFFEQSVAKAVQGNEETVG